MEITKAVTDGAYDEIKGNFLNPSPTSADPETETELILEDIAAGSGPKAEPGDTLLVRYTGKLENGVEFEKSFQTPFEFELGSPNILAGWNIGLEGMQAGGKRKLIIPPVLGYENQSHGIIPPNSILIFDIELVYLTKKGT
ncbi:MAG: FKBP-type peptidyl-prolyl cis-trans isomerase [Candidatus Wildermuthbacteria bacterium]|nr:FKBP-type peptidyl-prolyl cis-trans isomerase [Candidatus Wildermuthbacteria bacterium]